MPRPEGKPSRHSFGPELESDLHPSRHASMMCLLYASYTDGQPPLQLSTQRYNTMIANYNRFRLYSGSLGGTY